VPTPAPALGVVATPSIGSPTTDVWVASASADGAPYAGPTTLRPGRRGAADGHADGQPDRLGAPPGRRLGENPAAIRAVRLGLGHTRDVSMIDEVEVLEIDALPQERGDRFVAHTGFDPRALATPHRVPHLPAPHPGLARGERDARPRADARRPLVGLTPRPGAPRGRGPEAPRAEAAWVPWFLRRARPRPASAEQASRHPGRHRRSGRQRTVAATAPTKKNQT
jgi:hypothetical protein